MFGGSNQIMAMTVCKRCLIEDLVRDSYTETLLEYIKNYPEEKRVDGKTYESRLAICKNCRHLQNATCRKCGCFVQLRALKPKMECPSEEHYW